MTKNINWADVKEELQKLIESILSTEPPTSEDKKVTNLYVTFVDGQPKLKIEYEE